MHTEHAKHTKISYIYVAVISILGIILFSLTDQFNFNFTPNQWVTIFALSAGILLLCYFIIVMPPTGNGLTMDSAIYLASLFVYGLHLTLTLLLLCSCITAMSEKKTTWWKQVFNFAIYSIMIISAYYVFVLSGGPIHLFDSDHLMAYILALSVYFIINVGSIGIFFYIDASESLITVFQGLFAETIASYLSTLVLSIILTILLLYEHIFGLFLFVCVSMLLSFAFQQYFHLYQEVRKKANIDQLTGLRNHGAFKEILEKKIKEVRNNHQPLSLAVIDLDDFKKFNDYYGHLKGDELLKHFGKLIKDNCPETSIAARYGGEEFVILMPNTPLINSYHFLDRLRKFTNDTPFEGVEIFPHGCLSFSAGIIEYNNEMYDSSVFLERADKAMYFAKNQGKNNIHIYDENETHHRELDHIEKEMEMIEQQLKIFLSKDVTTYRHSRRVFEYASIIKDYVDLSVREKRNLVMGALIHDIGKLEIPREIIQKKGKLDPNEWELVKKHVTWGRDIVSVHKGLQDLLPLVELHHERYDGMGYPYGLKGEEIPKLARILCVVDSFDAMTTERPYQKTKSFEEAIKELYRCSGKQFDPVYVEAFVKMLNCHYLKNRAAEPVTSI